MTSQLRFIEGHKSPYIICKIPGKWYLVLLTIILEGEVNMVE